MRLKAAAALGLAAWMACATVASANQVAAKPAAKPATKAPAGPVATATQAVSAPALAASAPAISEGVAAGLERVFKTNVVPRFTVLADDELDADTRAAAQTMQAEHLPRVRALMDRWMLEELQQPNPQRAYVRVLARLANEFALWGRDTTGPAQDAALAQALQITGMCRPPGKKPSELVMRLARLRGLPAEVRQQAIQAERELLARWGQPRQVNEAEPLAAAELLLQLRATSQPPKTPLPPVLAYYYLGDTDKTHRDAELASPWTRCALHQWAGANPAQFRAAMAMQAADFFGVDRRQAAQRTDDDDPYPNMSNYFGARGVVTVQADVNAEGRLVRVKVVKRAVEVPGIRDVRPFAHEGTLDLASLAKAHELDWSAAAATQGGVKSVEREIEWSLKWR